MKRRRVWLVLALCLAVGGVAVAVICSPLFQKWRQPPVLVIPADDEVAEVRASLSDRPTFPGFDSIPEFVVPAEHLPVILGWLRPGEYISEPWRLDLLHELGQVVIRTHDGQELRVRFFDAGHNPAVLTVDGVAQFYARDGVVDFGGEPRSIFGGITLAAAVREAHEASKR
jgi:hypothetical protein